MTVHPPDLMPDLLTEAEAAASLHVSERTSRTIRAGKDTALCSKRNDRRWLSTRMVWLSSFTLVEREGGL